MYRSTPSRSLQRQLGRNAVCCLVEVISGKQIQPCGSECGRIFCRESCGCQIDAEDDTLLDFDFRKFEISLFDNNLSANLHDLRSLNEFVDRTFSMCHTFMQQNDDCKERFSLCLCDDWDKVELHDDERVFRTEGYSEHMLCIHPIHSWIQYPLTEMFPMLPDSEEYPTVIFSALHFLEQCFGYICLEINGYAASFNRDYMRFCREINDGMYFLCVRNELKRAAYRKYQTQSRDELTGLYLLEQCPKMWHEIAEQAELYREQIYITVISVNGLQQIENESGADISDQYLVNLVQFLSKCCNDKENLFQISRSGFVVIGMQQESHLTQCSFLSTHRSGSGSRSSFKKKRIWYF